MSCAESAAAAGDPSPAVRNKASWDAVSDPCLQDAVGLAGLLRRREMSARDVVSAHIARVEAFDPAINAIVTRTFDAALARAAAADEALARTWTGWRRPT